MDWCSFPAEALELVLPLVTSHIDRNSVSLVCKSWYDIERWGRRHVFIGNCYAVSPSNLTRRFTCLRSITLKGKHHLEDANSGPDGWPARALPWIATLAEAYPMLEEIRLKRMLVTDEDLKLVATKLRNLRVLVLQRCLGFSSDGLSAIADNCRKLTMLDLNSVMDGLTGDWISKFPGDNPLWESLSVLSVSNPESLVCRSSKLKTLILNLDFPLENPIELLLEATQLVHLGIGSLRMDRCQETFEKLASAFAGCKGLKTLSGLWDVDPYFLPAIYPACSRLTFLDLSNSGLGSWPQFIEIVRCCPNLQRLWVPQCIDDYGLEEVAASCKELQELKVFNSYPSSNGADLGPGPPPFFISEDGLISVAMGCPKLQRILYFCLTMTNAALFTVAKHLPNLTRFMINIKHPHDHLTGQPFDDGFGAVIEHCKNLKRLAIDAPFTDKLMHSLGTHGKKLEILNLASGRESSDVGLHHVLSGCTNLRKLSCVNCPFDGAALLANSDRLEKMRSLWMSSSRLSVEACEELRVKHPRLNVEVMDEEKPKYEDEEGDENSGRMKKLYVYRTIAGARLDKPAFVCSSNEQE